MEVKVIVNDYIDSEKVEAKVYRYKLDNDGHITEAWMLSSCGKWARKRNGIRPPDCIIDVDIKRVIEAPEESER